MKKTIVILSLFLMILVGCVFEPSYTYNFFRIINKSKSTLYVDIKEKCGSYTYNDTIKINEVAIVDKIPTVCFTDYKDSLLYHFFSKFRIIPNRGNLNINVYERKNWTDSLDLNGFGSCREGNVYYTLVIKDDFIK